jgi:hypothetical protein
MLQHGELKDNHLDDLGITNNMGTNKDQYVIPRRRMIFLTNEGFVLSEARKVQEKSDAVRAKIEKARKVAEKRQRTLQTPERRVKRKSNATISPAQRQRGAEATQDEFEAAENNETSSQTPERVQKRHRIARGSIRPHEEHLEAIEQEDSFPFQLSNIAETLSI